MEPDLTFLLWSAASIGFVHAVLGPDHYIPFVAMAKAGRWSMAKVLTVTLLCGVGHVAGSVILGLLGVGLGWAVGGMAFIESVRGEWAAWALIVFGLLYGVWGIKRAMRGNGHFHRHVHADGTIHSHHHIHRVAHVHVHTEPSNPSTTPWVLFTVFVLGPCEPLIPLLMVPAAAYSWWGLAMVIVVFGTVTISTMTLIVLALRCGLDFLPLNRLERWSHALAGLALFACGGAMQWLGL